jgi:hypothetical protein
MNVFISYSVDNRNKYLITMLVDELNRIDVSVNSSYKLNDVDSMIKLFIQRTDLFIGILSVYDEGNTKVKNEWKIAQSMNRPYIILIEKGLRITGHENDDRIICFDQNNIQKTLDNINIIIEREKSNQSTATAMAVILGGTALYGLFKILNDKKKRKK